MAVESAFIFMFMFSYRTHANSLKWSLTEEAETININTICCRKVPWMNGNLLVHHNSPPNQCHKPYEIEHNSKEGDRKKSCPHIIWTAQLNCKRWYHCNWTNNNYYTINVLIKLAVKYWLCILSVFLLPVQDPKFNELVGIQAAYFTSWMHKLIKIYQCRKLKKTLQHPVRSAKYFSVIISVL